MGLTCTLNRHGYLRTHERIRTIMNNKCINGKLDGMLFAVSNPTNKISYQNGYYLKSALREGDSLTLWVWHTNEEEPIHPITPH